ncbi:hypothetical protein [Flavobacterium sp. Arc2]|uniref:hypothetical protein n=1 Tax=Flavobacterium sp. Arc2 TaxID=3046685 RepID=UPI00352C3610
MKKIILLFVLATTFFSCSIDNDYEDNYQYEILPIESYLLPESFKLGETYTIKLKYRKPTECYLYQGIYYSKDSNIRTIAIQAAVKNDQVCTDVVPAESEVSFDFYPTNSGSYIFKFYKGKDLEGKDLFENVEIQVVD